MSSGLYLSSLILYGFPLFPLSTAPRAHPASCLYVILTYADPSAQVCSEQIPHLDPLARKDPHHGPSWCLAHPQHHHVLTPMIVCQRWCSPVDPKLYS